MNEQQINEQESKKLDVTVLIKDFIHSFKRLWIAVILIIAASTALFYFRTTRSYSPRYVSNATVAISLVNGGAYASRSTAEQMSAIFPYIVSSGALTDVVAQDLGTTGIPGTVSASDIKGTNLLTISVSAWTPENSYRVLKSVLKTMPDIAQSIIGQIEIEVVDESGIPKDTGKTAVVRGSLRNGLLIGVALAFLLVTIRALLYRTIRSESELRSVLNVPYLGTLPNCKKKHRNKNTRTEINILTDHNRGDYVEAMRLIRTRLDRKLDGKKILMVTSSVAGEGKSTVSANLAISMALKGKRVILVDCDLRNPSIGRIFNVIESCPGLAAVLNGTANVEDALVDVMNNAEPTGLRLMPGSDKASNSVEILSSDAMSDLLEKLKDIADLVILDTPPSAVLVDAVMLVRHVDAIAYVIMSDYARRRYIIDGIEELTGSGAPLAGCILNGGQTNTSKGYYGYYGRYGHYGHYSGYGYRGYGYGYGYGYGSDRKSRSKKDKNE